jgi:hypothetical protein
MGHTLAGLMVASFGSLLFVVFAGICGILRRIVTYFATQHAWVREHCHFGMIVVFRAI